MIRIYQIDLDKDKHGAAFMGSAWYERHNKSIDFATYELVYEGSPGCNNLEEIYHRFNVMHPIDYKGHSLSVSDIVELVGGDSSEYWFCDSFGWKQLEMNFKFKEE